MKNKPSLEALLKRKFGTEEATKKYLELTNLGLSPCEDYLISTFLPPKGKMLDIGCGCGRVDLALAKKGYKVTGVDFNENMITSARQLGSLNENLQFLTMDVRDLQFDKNSFDGVLFLFNGLSEMYGDNSRLSALKEIYGVLKPSGRFIFSVPLFRISEMHKYMLNYVKHRILQRDGEFVFGDIIFDEGTKYFNIPLQKRLKRKLISVGFEITFSDKRSNIRQGDNLLENLDSQYYVCQK